MVKKTKGKKENRLEVRALCSTLSRIYQKQCELWKQKRPGFFHSSVSSYTILTSYTNLPELLFLKKMYAMS